jgi:hypothetical protein
MQERRQHHILTARPVDGQRREVRHGDHYCVAPESVTVFLTRGLTGEVVADRRHEHAMPEA